MVMVMATAMDTITMARDQLLLMLMLSLDTGIDVTAMEDMDTTMGTAMVITDRFVVSSNQEF